MAEGSIADRLRAFWRPATKVSMRCGSKGRTMGKLWTSSVRYDEWGCPYASAHDGSVLRLLADGKTPDFAVYGTEWKHHSGPPVRFQPKP